MKKYYVKDILEWFQITRDALKYYEKQGIAKSYRDANGYRYYDFLAAKRIERALWLLKMGFSIDQIKHYLTGLPFEQELQMNAARIRGLEEEIRLLQEKLKFVRHMDAYQRMIPEYYRQYSICHDVRICAGCQQGILDSLGALSRREMRVLHLGEDLSVEKETVYEKVMAHEVLLYNDACKNCRVPPMAQGTFVQGIVKLSQMGDLQKLLPQIQADVDRQGYTMGREVYCTYGYYIEAEPKEEGIAVSYLIPLRRKEENL